MGHIFKLIHVAFACVYCFLLLEIVRTLYLSFETRAGYNKRSYPRIPLEDYARKHISRETNFTVEFSGIINLSENRKVNVEDGAKNLTVSNSNEANVHAISARDKCADSNLETISPVPEPPPFTALASYPRSGNAYTGLLIQISTQFHTSSVYWRNERKKPIAQKAWVEKSVQIVEGWKRFNMDWLLKGKRVLVVSFERLCDNTLEELEKIVKFLNQPVRLHQIQCAVTLQPCKCRDRVDFEPYYVDTVREYIAELNETLIRDYSTSLPTYGTKCPFDKIL
ncbi:hypothetical protein HOLleu_19546 [Holothuria leucospilota]|uniref:Sulfotransferase n=1 Tax=Holothuria leucospilota TaxID=206669 RepID=A0A9Q1BZQ9_HOLLE|nr:hypothetical protein HOLleu_19546 [Holothuria leucospilota]